MNDENLIVLETSQDLLQFDPQTGVLRSFRSKAAAGAEEQEFIAPGAEPLAFLLGIYDQERQYRWLPSDQAEEVQVDCERQGSVQTLRASYRRMGGQEVDVSFTVRASLEEPLSRWRIRLEDRAGLQVIDVQFPFIICAYDLGGTPGSEALLLPHGYGSGRLIQNPGGSSERGAWSATLNPDCWKAWEFTWTNWDCDHYPGTQFAQFLAYFNDRAGLYLACEDAEGNVKRFRALHRCADLHRDPGLRLGVAHVGDWPRNGERELEYDTVLRSFRGDWYSAAEIYREWSLKQKWSIPLTQREDVPAWLLDSPVYITIRPRGILDAGPDLPLPEFLPYEKCVPLLEGIARRVEAPLVAVLMGWEGSGSWVYPDSQPVVGGEASLKAFARLARARGWHLGTFCSGTRWATAQFWSGYDGRDYFRQQEGEKYVCREADGRPWLEMWDQNWRPSFTCCLGTEGTQRMATDHVRKLIDCGLESLQFFDQNNGSATFPCFANDHEHPPAPGKWMAQKMEETMAAFRKAADEAGEPGVIHSAESGVNEYCLPLFQESELRPFPPGYGSDTVPLYHFLYHECIVFQGMMGNAPEPYHIPLRTAVNCVWGQIPGGVLTGDGTLLDKDTNNWAPWEPKLGSHDDDLEMLRTVTALRRGPGRDFLVYGRMLRPAEVDGIRTVEWKFNNRIHRIPAVFHSTWQAPDGRRGIVLANWTARRQKVTVVDARLAKTGVDRLLLHLSSRRMASCKPVAAEDWAVVSLPPLSCALLEG